MRAMIFRIATTTSGIKHTVAWLDDDGTLRLDYRPVHMQTLSNEVETIPLKARVY